MADMYSNPFNEAGSGEMPDTDGDSIYFDGTKEIARMHLKPYTCQHTDNMRASMPQLTYQSGFPKSLDAD